MTNLEPLLVRQECSIREAMATIDANGQGIVLVVDRELHLMGTVTDGDVRRAILRGVSLDAPAASVMNTNPVSALENASPAERLRLMDEGKKGTSVHHLPMLDTAGRVTGIALRRELMRPPASATTAVVMAGGLGTRLLPLTGNCPKPLLPLAGRPIMEWIILGLRRAGICDICVTTHYMADAIVKYFGDGARFDVRITYVHEERLSGTAGALRLLPQWDRPLLVVNGDIATKLDFAAMVDYHVQSGSSATVGVRHYTMQVPYGVVKIDGSTILELEEKPEYTFFVNAGVYVLEPAAREFVFGKDHLDMTDLLHAVMRGEGRVAAFPIAEYWRDIGRPADYEQAQTYMAGLDAKQ